MFLKISKLFSHSTDLYYVLIIFVWSPTLVTKVKLDILRGKVFVTF